MAVEPRISRNYIHNNSGTGILLGTLANYNVSNPTIGLPSETYRAIITQNMIYNSGRYGIDLINGVGSYLGVNDAEANALGEVYCQSCYGLTYADNYFEPGASEPFIYQFDATANNIAGRSTSYNTIRGGNFGGGAIWDVNIAQANYTKFEDILFGTGNVNAGASANYTLIGNQRSAFTLTNASGTTTDAHSFPQTLTPVQLPVAAMYGSTVPAPSGSCTMSAGVTGNAEAGSFTQYGTCAGGTYVLTFARTAPHGWACSVDQQPTGDTYHQTTNTTTSCTLTGTGASGDLIVFSAREF